MKRWLQANPDAWHGWPTYRDLTYDEQERLRARLLSHDYPFQTATLGPVCAMVEEIRAQRRARYAREVAEYGW